MKSTKAGFTLAEILITLSIIGVIASMTIPSLVQDVQDAQLKTAWKKSYADIDQAMRLFYQSLAGNIKGLCTNSWDTACIYPIIKPYFNYIKECTGETVKGNCWSNTRGYRLDNGMEAAASSPLEDIFTYHVPGLVLANGSYLLIQQRSSCATPTICARFFVDVNGGKGPNTWGKDLYVIYAYQKNIAPYGSGSTQSCPSGMGLDCSAKYLYQ